MQRRNQKVIEESQCIALTPEQDRDLRAAAVRLATAAGYHNAGTVEFLYQPAEQAFAFLEVNTRLQVEHPVTELTTGLDLVKLQLHVAAGGRLEGEPPPTEGYAIEARLNAEDPQRAFAPAPGTIETLSLPVGPGVRVDTGVAEGDVIPPEYDSMIAKVIAHGRDRDEALARLHRALSQMTRRGARWHDEQVVPPRPPRPPGGAGRGDRHVVARPAHRGRRAPADPLRRRGLHRRGARRR